MEGLMQWYLYTNSIKFYAFILIYQIISRSSLIYAGEPNLFDNIDCKVGDIEFDGRGHYLLGEINKYGSIYANCDENNIPHCFMDDGNTYIMDNPVSCDELAENVDLQKTSLGKFCKIGDIYFHGMGHYLIGKFRTAGSIYASCDSMADAPTPKCYIDDGIADRDDSEINCVEVAKKMEELKANKTRQLGVMVNQEHCLWPQRVVCYKFDQDALAPNEKSLFQDVFQEYFVKTDITFIDIAKCKATYGEKTDVCNNCEKFTTISNREKSCFSSVGFANRNLKVNVRSGGCTHHNIYLHEIGHAIGLYHEHAHHDREVIILRDKLRVGASNYIKKNDKQASFTKYDPTSIMHYNGVEMCFPKAGTDINFCGIEQDARDGCVVPLEEHCDPNRKLSPSKELTPTDIDAITKLYESVKRHPNTPALQKTPVMTSATPSQTVSAPTTSIPAPSSLKSDSSKNDEVATDPSQKDEYLLPIESVVTPTVQTLEPGTVKPYIPTTSPPPLVKVCDNSSCHCCKAKEAESEPWSCYHDVSC